ncbi:MAG: hypothetical protein Q7R64_00370 [bacterium]|nr:hypothetical protein [bacterium]
MKVLLSWARKQSDPDTGILIERLERAGHSLVYFVGAPVDERSTPKGAVFHSYADAEVGKPALSIDALAFPPLDADLIQKLYHTESVVLTMMNRFFDEFVVDERRRIYYEMVRYWSGVLSRYTPDVVLFPTLPHFGYDYILYSLARLAGIKTIFFDDTRFPGRLLPATDLAHLTESLKSAMTRNTGKQYSLDDLAPDIRGYYESRSRKDYSVVPSYIADQKERHSIWKLRLPWEKMGESLRDFSFLHKAPRYLRFLARERTIPFVKKVGTHLSYPLLSDLRKEYTALTHAPDFGRPFVYFPLQKQPERTTSPQGDMFVDQLLALELVSSALPKGSVIYVKEHPLQWAHFGVRFSSSRYRGYYERISRIPNVVLIPLSTDSYRLINESLSVSAVTGSAGWEAVLRGKPAIIFGKVWYEDCQGIFKASSKEDCVKAFATIARGYVVNQESVIHYLKCFESVTIRAFIAPTAGKASTIGKEECMNVISDSVLKELNFVK